MNEVAQIASGPGPSWGVIVFVAIVVVVGVVAFLLGRKAAKHPEYFRDKYEKPADAAARLLASQGWATGKISEALTGWADRDLTAKIGGAYEGLPPEIVEAANKIAEYAKGKQ